MPNTQFITLLIITVFSMLAGIVSAVVLFGQLNAKKRERAELERKLENTVGAAMNSSVGNASAELERRLQDRLKELSDALYRYNEQTKNDYERFKNALNESIASSMRETASRLAEAQTAAAERISAEQKAFSEKLNTEQNALSERLSSEQRTLSDRLAAGQDSFEKQISDRLAAQNTLLKTQAEQAETRNKHFETVCTEKLAAMDASVKLTDVPRDSMVIAATKSSLMQFAVLLTKNCRRRSQSKSPKTSSLLMNVLNRSIRGSEKCRRLQAEWVILKRFFQMSKHAARSAKFSSAQFSARFLRRNNTNVILMQENRIMSALNLQ